MEWKIIIHEKTYTEIITSGVADGEASLIMAKDIRNQLLGKFVTKVLIDHRNIERVAGKTIEVYERPIIIRILGAINPIKMALLIKKEHKEFFDFFAAVFSNRGFKVKIFFEKEKAIDWLLMQ
jgi:hypothetical protein